MAGSGTEGGNCRRFTAQISRDLWCRRDAEVAVSGRDRRQSSPCSDRVDRVPPELFQVLTLGNQE